ncbi:MAG TPA: phage recombination protein Bet [Bryobacteraceae bacterium]|nr:phage recombination protein Bet [Bryobacteraceae bacterium]
MTLDIDLIKRTICAGATNDELALFISQCKRTGLDPFAKQIHAVKRWDARVKREVMQVQIGIDGFRLIADRTERYVPGREPLFAYENGQLLSATAFVKVWRRDGWHEVPATAMYAEYVQTNREGQPNSMWTKMPHSQLAKCAEALALRKAFPAELSGLYTADEMGQADNVPTVTTESNDLQEAADASDTYARSEPDPVQEAAQREAAERAEAERKAALRAQQAQEAKQAFADFTSKANDYNAGAILDSRESLQLLAKTLLKKDAPKTADLRAALEMPKQAWDLAIDDVKAALAKQVADAERSQASEPTAGMSEGEKEAHAILSEPTEAERGQTLAAITGGGGKR